MKFLAETTWEDVFAGLREREGNDPGWIECATKIKGWPDWESWRRFMMSQIGADRLSWQRFQFEDPMTEIPAMLMGPYRGWQSRVPKPNVSTFADLVAIPEQRAYWGQNPKIVSLMAGFTRPTELIGLIRGDTGKIVCLDGHHRATAVALARQLGQTVSFHANPTIVLAKLPAAETYMLDAVLARGSVR